MALPVRVGTVATANDNDRSGVEGPLELSVTIDASADILVVAIGAQNIDSSKIPDTVTIDFTGNPTLTKLNEAQYTVSGNGNYVSLWYITSDDPNWATGAHTVSITPTSYGVSLHAIGAQYDNVDPTTPFAANVSEDWAGATSSAVEADIASATDQLIVSAGAWYNIDPSSQTGTDIAYIDNAGTAQSMEMQDETGTAGTNTVGFTMPSATQWALVAGSLQDVAPGGSNSADVQASPASVSVTTNVIGQSSTQENIYIAFYNSITPSVPGEVLNNFQGFTAGSPQPLNDRLGAGSGWAIDTDGNLVAADNGRLAGSSQLIQELNRQGSYRASGATPGQSVIRLSCPDDLQSVTLRLGLCTTFGIQGNLTATVNPGAGSEQQITGINSSGNTAGSLFTFNNVTPENGEIVIQFDNPDDQHVFHNSLFIEDIVLVTETRDVQASPASISVTTSVTPAPGGSGVVSDSFDGSGAIGAHWRVYNPTSAPISPVRDGGFYRADITDNTNDITTWFHNDQGFLHYQEVTFPVGATPHEYEFLGVGVGPFGANFRDNLPYNSNDYAFAGALVGDPLSGNWLFHVVGHRGNNAQFTGENKGTVNGSSTVNDEGSNYVGAGVSFADIRIELHNDGRVLIKRRPVGGGAWTYINGGTGLVPGPQPNLGSAGDTTWLGFVTYGFGTSSVPFTGSFDAFNVIYEEAASETVSTNVSVQASPATVQGFGLPENWDFGTVISQDTSADAYVDSPVGQNPPVAGDLLSFEAYLRNKSNDALTAYPVSVEMDGLYPVIQEEYSPGLFIPSGEYYFDYRFLDQSDGLWGATGRYDVTILAGADITPNAFNLIADVTGAEINTEYGGSFVVQGTTPGVNMTALVSGDMEATLDGVSYSGADLTVQNGTRVYYRIVSSATYETARSGSVTINGVSDSLIVTTRAAVTPAISSQPQSQSVEQGELVSMTVSATNVASYQWYKNGSPVAGQTGATYSFTAELADDGATYYVILTSSEGGTTQSATATLSVAANAAPTITGSATHTINELTALSATYTIANRDGQEPSLSGANASLFSLVNVSGDQYRLSMAGQPDGTYNVTININDGVNDAVTLDVTVTVVNVVVGGTNFPILRTIEWDSSSTPVLVIGDTFWHSLTLKQGVSGDSFDLSGASAVKAAIVSEERSKAYTDIVELSQGLAGSDWASGIVSVKFSALITADIASHLSKEDYGYLELEVTISGDKYTWFAPVRIIPGMIN